MERIYGWMRSRKPHPGPATAIAGEKGEDAAYFYLRRLGWTLVARRWKAPPLRGDLDLIAWEGNTLCFVEVKTLTRRGNIAAEYAVNNEKIRMLRRMAAAYVNHLPPLPGGQFYATRFDIVAVYLNELSPGLNELPAGIEVMRDAFV